MYPCLKLASTLLAARKRARLELEDSAIKLCRVGLTDIDPFMELNNARQILYLEMGRWDYAVRCGFMPLMKRRHQYSLPPSAYAVRIVRRNHADPVPRRPLVLPVAGNRARRRKAQLGAGQGGPGFRQRPGAGAGGARGPWPRRLEPGHARLGQGLNRRRGAASLAGKTK